MAALDVLIARGIRRVRTELGMTVSELAALLGVHASTISRIETGQRRVRTAADARRIAALLGVRVGYLLRECPHCGYQPPAGYRCLRCGTSAEPPLQQPARAGKQ